MRRYQRERPGELIHVDVKKIAGIPDGGGWRVHGRGTTLDHRGHGAGYRYIHTALDDRTRIVYSEILDDEQAITAADVLDARRGLVRVDRHHAANESSPTTAPATGRGSGTTPAPRPAPP